MPRRIIKTSKAVNQKATIPKVANCLFASEFVLMQNENAYRAMKFMCASKGDHSKTGPGQYEIPVESGLAVHFEKLLKFCPERNHMAINRIRVQETGLTEIGETVFHYDKLKGNMARVIINIREREGSNVSLTIHLTKKASVTLPITRSFATIVPEAVSEISIDSGSNLRGTHTRNAPSVFVIIDMEIDDTALYMLGARTAGVSTGENKAAIDNLAKLAGKADSANFSELKEMMRPYMGDQDLDGIQEAFAGAASSDDTKLVNLDENQEPDVE